jgi:putative addiction module component (TIGR02574 family)
MSATLDQIKAQCSELTAQDRAELAYHLLQSLEGEEDGVEAAWHAEVRRRTEEIRAGRVKGKPASEVFAAVREKYG